MLEATLLRSFVLAMAYRPRLFRLISDRPIRRVALEHLKIPDMPLTSRSNNATRFVAGGR